MKRTHRSKCRSNKNHVNRPNLIPKQWLRILWIENILWSITYQRTENVCWTSLKKGISFTAWRLCLSITLPIGQISVGDLTAAQPKIQVFLLRIIVMGIDWAKHVQEADVKSRPFLLGKWRIHRSREVYKHIAIPKSPNTLNYLFS